MVTFKIGSLICMFSHFLSVYCLLRIPLKLGILVRPRRVKWAGRQRGLCYAYTHTQTAGFLSEELVNSSSGDFWDFGYTAFWQNSTYNIYFI